MDAYTSFASVYDTFMDNIPYEEWAEYLVDLLKEYGIHDGLVLDLGCGTGNMTELLASAGYDMIGVDNAEEMLEIAMEKREKSGHDILYLLQDMREFELYGTVKAIVSICDSINYITEEEDLLEVFRLANNYLDPKGIFIFDFNTVYKYREVLGNQTIAEDRDECSFIWDNYYYEDQIIAFSNVQLQQNIFFATIGSTPELISENLPYVEEADVSFAIPDTVKITITNATPSYVIKQANGYLLISSKGRILDTIAENTDKLPELKCGELKVTEVGKNVSFTDENVPDIE